MRGGERVLVLRSQDIRDVAQVERSTDRNESSSASTPLAQRAPDESVILLPPPLPLVGVSIVIEKGVQQSDSLADG